MDSSKYEAVLKAVQATCPELEQYETVPCPDGMVGCCVHHQRKVYTPARLSHVLRAIAKTNKAVTVNVFGHMQVASPSVSSDGLTIEWEGCDYDLTKDDLSLQSPETIDFLFKILCE